MEEFLQTLEPAPLISKSNHYMTSGLFYECLQLRPNDTIAYRPIFTLGRKRPGYVSARELFVQLGDETGYEFAVRHLAGWDHWEYLMKAKWFQEAVAEWRAELKAKQAAEALKRIQDVANDPTNKGHLAAARYIHEQNTKSSSSAKRGRPSKEEVEGAIKQEVAARDEFAEDAERLGLTVINGGKI